MDKIEKMAQLVKEWEKASNSAENGIAAMFGTTEESAGSYEKMWNYAKNNGFINPFTGTITDRPILKIYANYKLLGSRGIVYTYASQQSDIFDELYIEIPEGFNVYDQADGMGLIISADEGYDYEVDELLTNASDNPAFVYVGKDGRYCTIKCKVLEEV